MRKFYMILRGGLIRGRKAMQKTTGTNSKNLLRIYSLPRKSVFILLGIFVLVTSCGPLPAVKPSPPSPPNFSYEPPSTAAQKSDIVLAMIAPSYNTADLKRSVPIIVPENYNRLVNIVDYFRNSMASDFEKMIVARGFTLTGPFSSLDYMTYPDKKRSDLTLSPRIYITSNYSTSGLGSPLFPAAPGYLTVSGYVNLIIFEPLSGEKMWIRKIDFEPESIRYEFSYYRENNGRYIVQTDNRVDALKQALERIYPKVMSTAWKYLDPEEIASLKRQSSELRKRKRY